MNEKGLKVKKKNINLSNQERISEPLEEGLEKVTETIEEGIEKVNETIEEGFEKVREFIEEELEKTNKLSTDGIEKLKADTKCSCEEKELFEYEDRINAPIIIPHIYNVCGNSNEVQFPHADISVFKGSVDDLNDNNIRKLMDTISGLSKMELGEAAKIVIPVYIININNILTSGNKNTVDVN